MAASPHTGNPNEKDRRQVSVVVRWAEVWGPAAACYASARRLGWTVQSAFEFTTDTGQQLALMRDSPAFVFQRVSESVQRWRNRAIAKRLPGLAGVDGLAGPRLYPIIRLLTSGSKKVDRTTEHRGALQSAVTGRQCTQQRLHKAGLVESAVLSMPALCCHP